MNKEELKKKVDSDGFNMISAVVIYDGKCVFEKTLHPEHTILWWFSSKWATEKAFKKAHKLADDFINIYVKYQA